MDSQETFDGVAKNSFALITGNIVCRILGFVTFIIIARYLGPNSYGVFNLIISFIQIAAILANFGYDIVYIREVARNRSESAKYFQNGLILKLIFSTISCAILLIIIYSLNYEKEIIYYLLIFSSNILFQGIFELISSVYKSLSKMKYVSYLMLVRSIIAFGLTCIVIETNAGMVGVFNSINASYITAIIFFTVMLSNKKYIAFLKSFDKDFLFNTIKLSTPFVLIGIVHIVNFRVDIILLSIFANETQVGYYSAVNELVASFIIIPTILSTAIFPRISKIYSHDQQATLSIINFGSKILIALGIPIGVGIFSIGYNIVLELFGTEYSNSVNVLKILGIGVALTYVKLLYSWFLTAINLEKYALREYCICLTINIFLDCILIPKYGADGAAFGCIFSGLIGYLYLYKNIKNKYKMISHSYFYIKPVIASCVMGIILSYINNNSILFLVPIGIVIYGVLILILKTFSIKEMKIIISGVKIW